MDNMGTIMLLKVLRLHLNLLQKGNLGETESFILTALPLERIPCRVIYNSKEVDNIASTV